MAKEFPDNKTLEVYQQGGATQSVNSCPEAISDDMINIDNRERSIVRSNYSKSNTESKCGNCIFFDISNRIKKCADTKSDNKGYCWDQEFVCESQNICDMWEEGGPIKSNKDSYAQDESSNEFEQNKAEVEQIQTQKQMPVFNESQQQPMAPQQGAPPQAMPPQQQAPAPQEQMQPSFAYGGSLRKAQEQHETNPINPVTGLPFEDDMLAAKKERDLQAAKEREAILAQQGQDNNTDIYDEANPKEAGSSLKDKYKNWRTKRAIKKYQKSLIPEAPFMMYNSDPSQGVLGEIGNWMKSAKKDFTTNWDNNNKKSNYQQFKVSNPHDDVRFFDQDNPDAPLLNYGQKNSNDYNKFSTDRTSAFPELYQISSMDNEGNISYTGEKLLGDMVETEYMPDAVHIQHTEDGTGVTGAYIYTGMSDAGKKEYEFVPFDKENPTQISVGPSKQKRAEQEMADKNICINAGGEWDAGVCTYPDETTKKDNLQKKKNENFKKTPLNIEFDKDKQFGGTPTFAHMRDGGSLSKFQSQSEWTDEQLKTYLKLQNEMLVTGGVDGSKIDLSKKDTWPSVKFSVSDGTYNTMYPWLPDMSTKEGKSQMYNLHKTASDKFPDQTYMPGVYWGSDDEGGAYPYLNETVEGKEERARHTASLQRDFATLQEALAFAKKGGYNTEGLSVNGVPIQNVSNIGSSADDIDYGAEGNFNRRRLGINRSVGTDDLTGTVYDAAYKPYQEKLQKEYDNHYATKSGVDNWSMEKFMNEYDHSGYKQDWQEVTADNMEDAINYSGNQAFEGSMGGYGGGAIGYNSGNSEYIIGNDTLPNPQFQDHGRNKEMTTDMGYIPGLVGGMGGLKLGMNLAKYVGGFSVPYTQGALTFGNVANGMMATNGVVNTLPTAVNNFKEGDWEEGLMNTAFGLGEMTGFGNMGTNILPKTFNQVRGLNSTMPALNIKGQSKIMESLNANKNLRTFNANPLSKRPSQLGILKDYMKTNYTNKLINPNFAPKVFPTNYTQFPGVPGLKYGGSLPKAQIQNGAHDVAANYQVNPAQFDYDTNMPKEGAISAYGDVWQGGQWVDATVEEQGFNTPNSDQFGNVKTAFSDETGVTNRNANYDPDRAYPFSANAINKDIKSAAANSFDVRRKDIDMNTYKPEDGSINKSYGDIYNSESGNFDDNQFTPMFDQTDDFAFEGDNNTLSRRQLRDVRQDNRRQARAEDKGFGSYEDMQTDKSERKAEKRQRRKDKRDRWGETPGARMTNKVNYALDSNLGQLFQKGSKAAVEGAKIINNQFDGYNEDMESEKVFAGRSAGSMYGVTSSDALSRGEHDKNTGIFQPDDKVISRWGKYGTELPRAQGQMETASIYDIPNKDGSYNDQNWFTKANHGFSEGVYNDAQRTNHGVAPIVGGGIIGKMADVKSIYDFGKSAYDGVSNWINEEEVDEIAGTPEGYAMDMAKYGGHLKAQNQKETGLKEFCVNGPIIDSGGRVFSQCQNRDFDSKHDLSLYGTMSMGKLNDEFTSSFGLAPGYTFNPSGGTNGLKTYVGGNYGLRATEDSSVDDGLNGTTVDMDNYMKLLASVGYTGEVGGNNTQYGFGAYADKDLMGDNGTTYGGYANVGPVTFKGGINPNTGPQFSLGIGAHLKQRGGEQKQKTVSVNSDMYYELIAAGADIEII